MGFLKDLIGSSASTPAVPASQARVQKTETRIEAMRKGAVSSKDALVRGQVQVSSARDYVARSLGKQNAPTRGTSLARLGSSPSGMNPFTPPRLPPIRPLGR
jgi:hypothetical protein